jgi:hypothetical protein
MGIADYVSFCMQLYCVGFHCLTTCFGLHGHLQVWRIFYFRMLEGFCFTAFFLPFFHVVTLHVFHLLGGLNMRYYYFLFMLFLVLLYVCFLLTCVVFLCCFPSCFFCVFSACSLLWLFVCSVLLSVVYYLLCNILNIGLLGSMASSFMCRLGFFCIISVCGIFLVCSCAFLFLCVFTTKTSTKTTKKK